MSTFFSILPNHAIKINPLQFAIILLLIVLMSSATVGGIGIGVSYPRNGDDLPKAQDAIALCKSHNIERIRLYDPTQDALEALKNTGIQVILGVSSKDIIVNLASSPNFTSLWVGVNVLSYTPFINFRCIALGDEFALTDTTVNQYLLTAMIAIKEVLNSANLSIPVSFSIHSTAIPPSLPPSTAYFDFDALPTLKPMIKFLQDNKYPVLYPVYSYVVYLSDPIYEDKPMYFPMLENRIVVVQDGEFGYTNILDVRVDAVYTALEKDGAFDVEVIVSETGWPSCEGTEIAKVGFAELYNNNLIKRMRADTGTPKRPNRPLQTYIFSLFSQDYRNGKFCYGLFYPNMTQVYPLQYSLS